MRLHKQLTAALLIALMPMVSIANNMQFDITTSLAKIDAGSNSSFENGKLLTAFFDYYFTPWFSLNVGLTTSDKIYDKKRNDIVGKYQANLQTRSLQIGIKLRRQFNEPFEIYGRLGLQNWETELEVEEYFGPGIPPGSDSARDQGIGYYISLGAAHLITASFSVQIELSRMQQPDVFKEQSGYPFDLTITGIGIGMGYRF